MAPNSLPDLLLRVGVAFALLYPPWSALQDPNAWIGYFPLFVKGFLPDVVLLHAFGVVEVLLALWILSGWKIFYPSLVATLMLVGIVVLNIPEFQVLFRDLSLAAMALALALLHLPRENRVSNTTV